MLIDDLLYGLDKGAHIEDCEATLQRLSAAARFEVDNVARYAYDSLLSIEGTRLQTNDLQKHIPNVAPLAPSMWFEFGGLAKGAEKPATNRYGCLISTEYDRKHPIPYLWEEDVPEHMRWILRAQCFAHLPHEYVFMRWIHYLGVADDGGFTLYARSWASRYGEPTTQADCYNETAVALLAICFAHCKGARIQEHQPSRQVRRAAERAHKPVFSFHTIDITPATRVLRGEGQVEKNGIRKALHITRGHFAHYTAEKPLFGKYVGTFYKPMHVRGSAEQGVVDKEYRVQSR